LPNGFKDTYFGQLMMLGIELTKLKNNEIEIIRKGQESKLIMREQFPDGEVSVEGITRFKQVFNDVLDMASKAKENKTMASTLTSNQIKNE